MYFIAPLVILVICLAIFFSPILAVLLAVIFLIGLGVYKFLGPGTEPERAAPPNQAATRPDARSEAGTAESGEEESTGPWGETWPEKS
jgi:hypothetical protein